MVRVLERDIRNVQMKMSVKLKDILQQECMERS